MVTGGSYAGFPSKPADALNRLIALSESTTDVNEYSINGVCSPGEGDIVLVNKRVEPSYVIDTIFNIIEKIVVFDMPVARFSESSACYFDQIYESWEPLHFSDEMYVDCQMLTFLTREDSREKALLAAFYIFQPTMLYQWQCPDNM